jgi:hypothetical protein
MPPTAFMQRPLRWLRAIDEHRSDIAGGPNFGYDICVRRIPAAAVRELDLSSWRVAFSGSEPIRAPVLREFARHFSPAGFDPDSFLACYGLAEATLLCTAGPLREIPYPKNGQASSLVSAGRPASGCSIAIVYAEGLEDAAGVGEITISGPHVSPGRWCSQTAAVVPFDTGQGGLRTGDIGTIIDGELIVLDRVKDVVAIYGRKIHAIDVERPAIEGSDGLVLAAAAFSVSHERGERLVTLCEVSARDLAKVDQQKLTSELQRSIHSATGISSEVHLLRHGMLPRTTSGKIRRQTSRSEFLAGEFSASTKSSYKSPVSNRGLTDEQVRRFQSDGVLFPVEAISASEAEAILAKLEALERERAGRLPPSLNAKPHLLLPWLWDIVHDPRIVDAVAAVLGEDIVCFGTSFIAKSPGDGKYVTWHQDATHWGLSSPDGVTAWLALTPSNHTNGRVRFIPGTHRLQLPHDHPDDRLNMLGRRERVLIDTGGMPVVDADLAPGEMSLHHPLAVHGSNPNLRVERRVGFAIRYLAGHVRQTRERRNSATLVRGRDHGYFEPELRPEAPFGPEAVRRHAAALRFGMSIIFERPRDEV